MKTKILLLVILMIAATSSIFAQQGNLQPRTVEQRVKSAMEKISTPLNLNKDQVQKTSCFFRILYPAKYYAGRSKVLWKPTG
jgi:hypothetical protein